MGIWNPGIPSSQIPPGEDHVMRSIKDIERFLRELTPSIAHSFKPVIDRLDAADIVLAAQQATLTTTVAGLSAAVADIATNLASINSLLTQVVKPQAIYNTTNSWAITTTPTVRAAVTIAVPSGYTTAVVSVMGRVDGRNSNSTGGWNGAGGDLLHSKASIAGVSGIDMDLSVLGSGDHAVSVMPLATVLTGLSGGTITLTASVWSEYQGWASHAKNIAELSGTVTFVH